MKLRRTERNLEGRICISVHCRDEYNDWISPMNTTLFCHQIIYIYTIFFLFICLSWNYYLIFFIYFSLCHFRIILSRFSLCNFYLFIIEWLIWYTHEYWASNREKGKKICQPFNDVHNILENLTKLIRTKFESNTA